MKLLVAIMSKEDREITSKRLIDEGFMLTSGETMITMQISDATYLRYFSNPSASRVQTAPQIEAASSAVK